MAREYYYLVAGLPDLFLDQEKKEVNIIKLKDEMQELLHPHDYSLVELIHYEYDNYNFLNHILKRKQEFNPLGKFPAETYGDLDEKIELFPDYIQQFYKWYSGKSEEIDELYNDEQSDKEKIEKIYEVRFYEFFYRFISQQDNSFIKVWFSFLRDYNNILSAINCRKTGKDIASQLVGTGDIVDALVKSQAPDFGLKKEVDYIEQLLQISEISSVIERERKLDLLKWERSEDIITFNYFTIERILAFFVKAAIATRWVKLDPKIGDELFRKLVHDLRETYVMPKEFSK